MEQFDPKKKYTPKKRHGNRKPVVPIYMRPNVVPVFNAAYRMMDTDPNDLTGKQDLASRNFRRKIDALEKQIDNLQNLVNYLDNQID
jgi:hypothetical protein